MVKFNYITSYDQSKVLKSYITNNYDPTRVLFITFWNLTDDQFSEHLSNNVFDRYSNISMADLGRTHVSTFKSFVEDVVRNHSSLLSIPSDFKVILEPEIAAKLHQLILCPEEKSNEGETFQKELDSIRSQWCDNLVYLTELCVNRTFTKEEILDSKEGSLQLVSKLFEQAEVDNHKNNIDWDPIVCEPKAFRSYLNFSNKIALDDLDRLESLKKISMRMFKEKNYLPEERPLDRAFLRHAGVNDPLLRQLHAELGRHLYGASEDLYTAFEMLLNQYQEYKKKENVLDYYDLLEYFNELLDDTTVCQELGDMFDNIFVYGFQASNDIEMSLMSRMEKMNGNLSNKNCPNTWKRNESTSLDEWRPKKHLVSNKEYYSWFWNDVKNLIIKDHLDYSDIAIFMKDTVTGNDLIEFFNNHDIPFYTNKKRLLTNDEIKLLLGPLVEFELQDVLGNALDEDSFNHSGLTASYNFYKAYKQYLEDMELSGPYNRDWGLTEDQSILEKLKMIYSILSREKLLEKSSNSFSNRQNNIAVLFKLLERFLSEETEITLEKFLVFVGSWSDLSEFYSEYDAIHVLNLSTERPMDCKYVFYLDLAESRYLSLHTGIQAFWYQDKKCLYVMPVPKSLAWLLSYCVDQILKGQKITYITNKSAQQAQRILVLNKGQEEHWKKEPWHEGMPLYKKYI